MASFAERLEHLWHGEFVGAVSAREKVERRRDGETRARQRARSARTPPAGAFSCATGRANWLLKKLLRRQGCGWEMRSIVLHTLV
jgi:hypothetical protein